MTSASPTFCRGKGAQVWDTRGREFVDFTCSYGPIILGYADERVDEAVIRRIKDGILFPQPSAEVAELSGSICRHFAAADTCLFFKTGSEAVAAAVRLARTQTGRPAIVRCGFHGWHDAFISPMLKWHDPDGISNAGHEVPGVARFHGDDFHVWDGKSVEELAVLLARLGDRAAALIIDPVQLRAPHQASLAACRAAAHANGALLILDEIKTGLRTSMAGVQGLYGVWADITVLSKALANGFPLAAVVCDARTASLAKTTELMGTYNAEASALVAGITTLDVLANSAAHAHFERRGQALIDGFNEVARRHGLEDHVRAMPYRWACMPHIQFLGGGVSRRDKSKWFAAALLEAGFIWLPNHMNYISLAHTSAHVEAFLSACSDLLGASHGRQIVRAG